MIAPGSFSVAIAPSDYQRVGARVEEFCRELERDFTALAGQHQWRLFSSVSVIVVDDADVTAGSPRVHARFEKEMTDTKAALPDGGNLKTVSQAQLELIGGKEFWPVPVAGVKIGRSSTCDIQVDRPTVSRVHCELKIRNGTWVIDDVGSANGTYVNGEKLSAGVPVAADGEIRLGKSVLLRLIP